MSGETIRCTVESMQYSACGMSVGDSFEIDADGLRVRAERGFCYFAIASVLPMLNGRHGTDLDAWLDSKPLLACPDPPEALHMRLERVNPPATDPDTVPPRPSKVRST